MNVNSSTAPTGARCPLHPETDATGVCDRCGRFLCVGCIEANVKGRVVCSECLPDWVPPEGYYYVPPWRFVLLSILTVGV